TIPTKKFETFSTAVDGQSNVEIQILQGEQEMSRDNKSLGTFRLDGIPSAPRGVPQIEVTLDIDANGILNVTAKDKGTGKEQSISITGASTLDKTEVERMVREAETNASSDKESRDKIDRKNQADSLSYQAEKQLQELGDKVPADDKTKLEALIKELKEAVTKEDDAEIQRLTPQVQETLMAIGSNIYAQAGAEGGGGDDGGAGTPPGGGSTGGGDDVIDAEFSETK
ncbi:MAG: Hsp70 family protein, partial [Chamaesiphon sp.]|nr:Hsp70 family protein [Chamaesiphon sp.]